NVPAATCMCTGGRCTFNSNTPPFPIEHHRAARQSADNLLDQQGLRGRERSFLSTPNAGAADGGRVTEKCLPRATQSSRQAIGGWEVATVVIYRHVSRRRLFWPRSRCGSARSRA